MNQCKKFTTQLEKICFPESELVSTLEFAFSGEIEPVNRTQWSHAGWLSSMLRLVNALADYTPQSIDNLHIPNYNH
jgi:hypothetical protein